MRALVLLASASATVASWLAFSVKAPAAQWIERPLPFAEIHQQARTVGRVSDTTLLLLLLLAAYLALVWVVQTSPADLPLPIVVTTALLSGAFALRTYSLFAEDVYVVQANVWSYAVAGVNPYLVLPNDLPGNPYRPFITWGGLEYVYGPAWLVVGAMVGWFVGPGVVVNVWAMKSLLLATLWLMGALAWALARSRGALKPVGTAALVLWNPLLLAEGPMTPHLDLPMAAATLAGLLAWAVKREAAAVLWFALSVAIKFVTLLLAPAILGSMALAVAFVGSRRRARLLIRSVGAVALASVLLWPGAWEPTLQHGLPRSLELKSNTALFPNVITAIQAAAWLPPPPLLDPVSAARGLRWVAFVPLWGATTAACLVLGWKGRCDLPHPLLEPLALLLLGYHVLFSLWVLPWHLTTALCLCLVAASQWGPRAGFLITSGLLFDANQWAWTHPWGDPRWVAWILGASLLAGPILAMPLLCLGVWTRRTHHRPVVAPGGAAPRPAAPWR